MVPEIGQFVAVKAANIDAVQRVAAGGGAVEAADGVHQGGLAGAAGAHDGDELAGKNLQGDVAHGMHLDLARVIGLAEVFQLDDWMHEASDAR